MRVVGVGWRQELAAWAESSGLGVQCLELTAEHFFGKHQLQEKFKGLGKKTPLYLHGLGLSLGTPGKLDEATLKNFAGVSKEVNPEWVSEHISFTRTDEIDLGHLNPVQPTREMLEVFKEHVHELRTRCGKPVILENISSHLKLPGEMSETVFLNQLCETSDCGLLLDATNLFINAKNHQFDAQVWVKELDAQRIVQLHAVGYSVEDGIYQDHHSVALQDDLLELIAFICERAPVKAITLEWDSHFPSEDVLNGEIRKLKLAAGLKP